MSDSANRLSIAQLKTERAKRWAVIIPVVIGNLVIAVTAIGAHMKAAEPEKETTAKAAYTELSAAVTKLSTEQIKLHTDISNMRGYLAGMASHTDHSSHMSIAEPVAPVRASRRHTASRRPNIAKRPPAAIGGPLGEPPEMSQKPAIYSPPSIDTLQKSK